MKKKHIVLLVVLGLIIAAAILVGQWVGFNNNMEVPPSMGISGATPHNG